MLNVTFSIEIAYLLTFTNNGRIQNVLKNNETTDFDFDLTERVKKDNFFRVKKISVYPKQTTLKC